MAWITNLNERVAKSAVGRHFKLEGSGVKKERTGSTFTTEIRAGVATFVTMAYIISVNAAIIADSGGPCKCTPAQNATGSGLICVGEPAYTACQFIVRQDLITATTAASLIATFLMGAIANLPLGLAPGMGINAYFTYTVVGFNGTGKIAFETALAAVFIEGIIFFILTILGIRQWLARIIPMCIKIATGSGIGLFLCFIGLQSSAGIGAVGPDSSTLVTLSGCPAWAKDPTTGACTGHRMESPTTWMGILGLIIMSVLLLFRVKGAILIGILFISIISWPRNSSITYFPYTEAGDEGFDFFKKVVSFHPIEKTLAAFNFDLTGGQTWIALITFLYVDIMDTTGTLYSMAKFGGFLDKNGDFEGSTLAFMCDAISISIGAVLGTSPCTTFIESGAGITEGGRTGITAVTTAFCFFISLFFAPIFASLPPWATGPALILIGSLMMASAKNINWEYVGDSVPAFLTMALIPLTYSIAYSVIAGIVAYVLINGSALFIEKVSYGRITHDKSKREIWWTGFAGVGIVPIWIKIVAAKAQGKEYKHEAEDGTVESFEQMKNEKGVEELPVAVRITE